MKIHILVHLFGIAVNATSTSDQGARLNRLRFFIDQVKEYTREDSIAAVVDADVSAQLVKDAVEFAQGGARDAEVVFHAMGILCRNPVARMQVDNVMWAAVDKLCSTTTELVETSPLTETSNTLEVVEPKRSRKRVHFAVDLILTTTTEPVEAASTQTEASNTLEYVDIRSPQVTPTGLVEPGDRCLKRKCVEELGDYEKLRGKLEPYFSVESNLRLYDSPSKGMMYIAYKHVGLVEARAYSILIRNLEFLEQTDIAADKIAFLFHDAHSRLISLSRGATEDPHVEALVEEGDLFVKRPFDQAEFLLHMNTEFCSNPTPPHPHSSSLPRKLATKVAEGDLRSLRTNVEFLELAGVTRESLARLLSEACRLLFTH